MARSIRFAEGLQVVPLLTPGAFTADNESAHVKLENFHWLTFLIQYAAMTVNTTDSFAISVKSTTNAAGSTATGDYALPFWYREYTAIATDYWGTITAVTTATGSVTITGDTDGGALLIDVDPAVIPGHDADATHLYLDIDVTGAATDITWPISISGIFEPRYPQAYQKSSTSAAT